MVTPEKILEFLDLTKYIKGKSVLGDIDGNQVLIQKTSLTKDQWLTIAFESHLADFGTELVVLVQAESELQKALGNIMLIGTSGKIALFCVTFDNDTKCLNVVVTPAAQEHENLFEVSASAFDNYLKSL